MGLKITALAFLLLTLFVNSHQSSYSAQTTECPANFNGSIAGEACSREYSICINGVRQDATCIDGQVFHDAICVPKDESPECEMNYNEVHTELPNDFDCGSKPDGAYSLGCKNSFVKCIAGHAYNMYCPVDLFYNANYDKCLDSCDTKPSTDAPRISKDDDEANDEPGTDEPLKKLNLTEGQVFALRTFFCSFARLVDVLIDPEHEGFTNSTFEHLINETFLTL